MAIEVPNSLVSNNGLLAETTTQNNDTTVPLLAAQQHHSQPHRTLIHHHYHRLHHKYRHLYPIVGLFLFYVGHDALQERMFRFDGFEFGFFMTLVEVMVMLVGSVISEGGSTGDTTTTTSNTATRGKCSSKLLGSSLSIPTLIRIGWVGLFLALAHGLGNTALRYSPYPLKVAFKSCKLVPTMALGACVTGRKHTSLQYTAALIMGMGLAALTAADVFNGKNNTLKMAQHQDTSSGSNHVEIDSFLGRIGGSPLLGPILLMISTFFDSVVPNLQEQLLRTAKVKTSEMIFVSNTVMCIVLLGYTAYSGELYSAWNYCLGNREASGILFLQGICAYFGLKSYLAIIRDHGGVVGVLLANARKIVTIVLSFLLFAKPFNARHMVGLVLVFVGVYLGYLSKRGGKSSSSKDGRRKQRSQNDQSHEHSV